MGYTKIDFYNPEIKQKFLDYKRESLQDQSVGVYERLLKSFAEDEYAYGMDFCDFDSGILKNVLSNKLSRSSASRATQLSQLRDYEAWCTVNNIKKNNDHPIQYIRVEDIDVGVQIRKQFIKDPEHLASILDDILLSEKEDIAFDIMLRMACWLLYSGFTEDEVILLEKRHVDIEKGIVSINGKSLILDEQLRTLVKSAVEISETQMNIGGGGVRVGQLEDTDFLLRRVKRRDLSDDKLSYLRQMLARLSHDYKENNYEVISLSPQRLWLSGVYYRLYKKEQTTILTNEDYRFNLDGITTDASIRVKINDNRTGYKDWKNAFD